MMIGVPRGTIFQLDSRDKLQTRFAGTGTGRHRAQPTQDGNGCFFTKGTNMSWGQQNGSCSVFDDFVDFPTKLPRWGGVTPTWCLNNAIQKRRQDRIVTRTTQKKTRAWSWWLLFVGHFCGNLWRSRRLWILILEFTCKHGWQQKWDHWFFQYESNQIWFFEMICQWNRTKILYWKSTWMSFFVLGPEIDSKV